MSVIRLKIDVAGTVGDEVWRKLRQFDQIQSAGGCTEHQAISAVPEPTDTSCSANHHLVERREENWRGHTRRWKDVLLKDFFNSHACSRQLGVALSKLGAYSTPGQKDKPPQTQRKKQYKCVHTHGKSKIADTKRGCSAHALFAS